MIFVVNGPIQTRFARLIAKILTMGASTLSRLFSAKKPSGPDDVEPNSGEMATGYVRARMTGRAVWRPKKIGKMACWRDENWGRGRAL